MNFHFASARHSYQLGVSEHRAGLLELEQLVCTAKFIEKTYPAMHTFGSCFKDDEALKQFTSFSLDDINTTLKFLADNDLLAAPLPPLDKFPPSFDDMPNDSALGSPSEAQTEDDQAPTGDEKMDTSDEKLDTGADDAGDDDKGDAPASPTKSTRSSRNKA